MPLVGGRVKKTPAADYNDVSSSGRKDGNLDKNNLQLKDFVFNALFVS